MAKYRRTAEWIWRDSQENREAKNGAERVQHERNRYIHFRKDFLVAGAPESVKIDVSADGRYVLFLNGRQIGRGPCRCSPEWQSYDTYEIAPYLQEGKNVLAALVHSYGRDTAWYELPRWEPGEKFGCGGFFLQGSIPTEGGRLCLDTGHTWRYLLSDAWEQDTLSGQTGFSEVFDFRKFPKSWQEVDFDDRSWSTPRVLREPGDWGGTDVIPFPIMTARDIPLLPEEIHLPCEVVFAGEIDNLEAPLEEAISNETLLPLEHCVLGNSESLAQALQIVACKSQGNRSAVLVVDFGKTEQGRLSIAGEGCAGAVIDVRYGEYLDPDGRVGAPPWSWGDGEFSYIQTHRLILDQGPFSWEQFEYAGYRYAQLTIRNCDSGLSLTRVASRFTSYPVGERGRFECSDPLLNSIYKISAYTLQCCMLDSYEDCPTREQRQWTNDQFVHLMANYAMFGDTLLARRLLRQIAQSQRADGQVMMCAPGDYASTTRMNMSEFTLHWIMSFDPYLKYTGDLETVRELFPSILKGLSWAEGHLNEFDLLEDVSGILWIDWAEIDKKGELAEINCRFVGCLRIGASLAQRLGYAPEAIRLNGIANRITRAVNSILWDEARGVYVDTRRGGVRSRRISQQSNVAAMYFGVAPRERWQGILRYILDPARLQMTNAHGNYGTMEIDDENQVILSHAFYMHFLHAIMAEMGMQKEIAENILKWWGPQAREEVSTWAEAFEPEETHTLCHAFMCSPGFDLPAYFLGIQPLSEAFETFSIAPVPGSLSWAKGVFPSVKGDISVEWHSNETQFDLQVTIPPQSSARISLPEIGSPPKTIQVNNRIFPGQEILLDAGSYRIEASYL